MSVIYSGSDSVVTAGTKVLFPADLSDVNYSVTARCYDPGTLEDVGFDISPTEYAVDGFTVRPSANATCEWTVVQSTTAVIAAGSADVSIGGTVVSFPTPLNTSNYALSFRCYDPDTMESIGCDVNPSSYTDTGFTAVPYADGKLEYIAAVYGSQIGLLAPSGRLSRLWTAQKVWQEAVRDLGLDNSVSRLDFEQFRLINRAVQATISAIFPVLAKRYLTAVSINQSGNKISLSGLNVYSPEEPKIVLHSTATDSIKQIDLNELEIFRPSAAQNLAKIVWALAGDYLYLKTALAGYGTLTFYYPRQPIDVAAGGDLLDVPDGAMSLVILKLKHFLSERSKKPTVDVENEMAAEMQRLYSIAGIDLSMSQIKEKVKGTI